MTTDHPLGLTGFELRELAGHPHAWEEMDAIVATEQQLKGNPDWVVTSRFFVGSAGPQLVSLVLQPASRLPWPPSPPLNTAVLRSVRLDDLHRRARAAIAIGQHIGIGIGIGIETESSEFRRNRRPGKVGRPDIFYAKLAARYLQLVETTSSPTKRLAAEAHRSQSQARDLIHEARRRKLLTKTERGRAGGRLTEKAKRLLLAEGG